MKNSFFALVTSVTTRRQNGSLLLFAPPNMLLSLTLEMDFYFFSPVCLRDLFFSMLRPALCSFWPWVVTFRGPIAHRWYHSFGHFFSWTEIKEKKIIFISKKSRSMTEWKFNFVLSLVSYSIEVFKSSFIRCDSKC